MPFWDNLLATLSGIWQNNIWAYLQDISWINILDILVLAVLLHLAYKFMQDRRAGKLALGVVIFLGILILSSVLRMNAIRFIFQNFYQIGLLAVVIVFQPELRAGLEKMGNSPFSSLKSLTSDQQMAEISADIDVICDAAGDMARTKTGALIVIERSTKLGEYIKSGVVVNAQLSSLLLRNIFFNKAPLHDGSVIIRGRRIFAAGCFLPLSDKDDIIQDLGTRHRAAIGLSECSDAVVIVVSEETGVISLAVNGKLTRDYNYSTLKQELLKLLTNQRGLKSSNNAK